MKLVELLKKLLKAAPEGTLTEEESTYLGAYDPQRDQDQAAAAAKKEQQKKLAALEKERDDIKGKLGEAQEALKEAQEAKDGKQDASTKLEKRLQKLEGKLQEKDDQLKTMAEETRQAKRGTAIGKLMASVKFVDGVDVDMVTQAFHTQFADLEDDDLGDAATTGPLVKGWLEKNAAIVQDTSGHGSGGPGNQGSGAGGGGKPDAAKMTDGERAKHLAGLK